MLSYDHAKLQFHRSITCSFGVRAFIVSEDESESPHSFLSEREGRLIPSRQWSAPRVDSLIRNSHLHVQSIGTHQGKRFDKTNMTHKNPNVSLREAQSLEWARFFQNVSLLHPAFHRSQCWPDGGSIPSQATRWCHEVHSQSFTSRKHIPFSGFSLGFRCRAKTFQPRVPSRDSELYYAELKKNCQRYSLKSGKTDITETYTPDSFLSKFLLNFKTVFKIVFKIQEKKIHH